MEASQNQASSPLVAWGGVSRTAELGGAVHYVDFGGAAGAPRLVLVHGLSGSHLNWCLLAPRLAANARLLAVDLVGFGRTHPEGRAATVHTAAVLLDRFVREVAGAPAILVGNSMGGMVSIMEAVANPDAVAGLVLIDPVLPLVGGVRPERLVATMFMLYAVPGIGERYLARRRAAVAPRELVRQVLELCCVDPTRVPQELVAASVALAEERVAVPGLDAAFLSAARSLLRVSARRGRYWAAMRKVRSPVLLIHGEQDRLVSVHSAREAAARNPDWRFEVLADVGHVPQLEVPDAVAELMLVARQRRRPRCVAGGRACGGQSCRGPTDGRTGRSRRDGRPVSDRRSSGRPRSPDDRPRIGLVLGAGGTVGEAFHRGVVRAMDDLGVDARAAEVIVGTSAGALVAASLRRSTPDRPSPAAPRTGRPARSQRGLLLDLAQRPRQGLNALLLRPEFTTGRLDVSFVAERLQRMHGTAWPTPELWIVAVRRRDGRRVVFGRLGAPVTDVGSAVAASCAIPAYFTPIRIDGVDYLDGGVHSPTNADLLAGRDLDLVVVSAPMSVDGRSARPRVDLPIRLRFRQLLRGETWTLHRHGLRIVTIEPDTATLQAMGLNLMRARRIEEVEAHAYRHARRRLQAAARTSRPAEPMP